MGTYGPEPEGDSLLQASADRFRWLQWLQLAFSSALLVMFFNQLTQIKETNRRIARLHERMDLLDRSRMMDTSAALEAQQRTILQRLQVLESALSEVENERMSRSSSSDSNSGSAALQSPPPPPSP